MVVCICLHVLVFTYGPLARATIRVPLIGVAGVDFMAGDERSRNDYQ